MFILAYVRDRLKTILSRNPTDTEVCLHKSTRYIVHQKTSDMYPFPETVDTTCAINRDSSPYLNNILGYKFPVLDRGFVRPIDYMGSDQAVVQMARVSYGTGTKSATDDRGLIRYLMRHRHTSPFEGCELKLHVKLPIFVARQWIRHRTMSVNEISGRYSILPDEYFIPDHISPQSTSSKQGRATTRVTGSELEAILDRMTTASDAAFEDYAWMLNDDGTGVPVNPTRVQVAREQARTILPLNTYTEWYCKFDLHNLLNFLRLRDAPDAQAEIRAYAQVIAEQIVKPWVPFTYEAYEDYIKGARIFSRHELEIIRRQFMSPGTSRESVENWVMLDDNTSHLSVRERKTFLNAIYPEE